MGRELAPDAEIMELEFLRREIDNRIDELRRGGVPMGSRPGMGQNVGPDIPPMNVSEPMGLLV